MGRVWTRTPVAPDGRLGPAAQHPGQRDIRYLERRNALARLAHGHRVGEPSPYVEYTEAEHATWRTVHAALAVAHPAYACRAVLEAREGAPVPADHVPQHGEVGARLRALTGFDFTLAGGVVENKRFLGSMERGYFHAVQFVRHPAMPLYTPEPDVLHDVFGHGIHLSDPRFADLYRTVGRAAMRVRTAEALELISHLYWFTLEYGVMVENGEVKAYGAALLSSYGELAQMARNQVYELDVPRMAATRYQISGYQPVLFAARSLEHLTDFLGAFLDAFDDDTPARLGLPAVRVGEP
ncbi:phenylalanine 4-monooxygenase [Streptomyces sp. URMC 123]|uniref:phenylalanine 4-monooxygenase n=1 Tax=Streptomyces sp. URMC 123 TaxID=3423403 RepID=UPI003F1C9458